MADKQFADGIRAFKPNAKAPGFVKVELTINKAEFTAWLASQQDEVRLTVKQSQKGTYYTEVNTFTPQQKENIPQPQNAPHVDDTDLPF